MKEMQITHLCEHLVLSDQVPGDVESVKEVHARNLNIHGGRERQGHTCLCNNGEEIVMKSRRKQAAVQIAARQTRLKRVDGRS